MRTNLELGVREEPTWHELPDELFRSGAVPAMARVSAATKGDRVMDEQTIGHAQIGPAHPRGERSLGTELISRGVAMMAGAVSARRVVHTLRERHAST